MDEEIEMDYRAHFMLRREIHFGEASNLDLERPPEEHVFQNSIRVDRDKPHNSHISRICNCSSMKATSQFCFFDMQRCADCGAF